MLRRCLIAVLICIQSIWIQSGMASEAMLNHFFKQVDSLQAEFTQRVVDETGMTLDQSSGMFYLSRPGKFRWNYSNPDPAVELGQQIIADGKSIFMYDPDLEQVTQRSMANALLQVPSLLLVQDGGEIETHFEVIDLGLTDGLSWVVLKPKSEDATYQQLMIGFYADQLRNIVLLDGLGNETRLELSNVVNNANLPKGVFGFVAPEGVDVFVE